MKNIPIDSEEVLDQSVANNLYINLLTQLNKDFQQVGIEVNFDGLGPQELVFRLEDALEDILKNSPSLFSTLLYRIDIPEKTMLSVPNRNLKETMAYLILKREWQKVYFRNYYSK